MKALVTLLALAAVAAMGSCAKKDPLSCKNDEDCKPWSNNYYCQYDRCRSPAPFHCVDGNWGWEGCGGEYPCDDGFVCIGRCSCVKPCLPSPDASVDMDAGDTCEPNERCDDLLGYCVTL